MHSYGLRIQSADGSISVVRKFTNIPLPWFCVYASVWATSLVIHLFTSRRKSVNMCRCSKLSRKPTRLILVPTVVTIIFILYLSGTVNVDRLPEGFFVLEKPNAVPDKRCKWPPDSTQELLDPITGSYDLTLRPCLEPNTKIVDPCMTDYYKRMLSVYQGPPLVNKSCLRRLVEIDEQVRMNRQEPNYSLYPEMGNVLELVMAIKEGKTVSTVSENLTNFNYRSKIHKQI